ncbi:acetoin utilization deacetylase AcuC-like enzyme [Deinobacterium chartae]|uniref:Acetoin utilization deacetylase AcuC-like enzyme n=1 Tax=Deinobacterium chartae TaxID=521158 RepID=A0A841HYP3_9DEIO|nr:histone deacetylase [Deinobacterium chartae]MBB6097022.1 acetoin utilization deacetylase AcuC-like enzyme [Deinobacterium chartae]
MRVAYSPAYYSFPLPEGHRFPLYKYAGVLEALRPLEDAGQLELRDAAALPWELAEQVHDPAYLRRWRFGDLERSEVREFGLPWSPQVVERARIAAGGTLQASEEALRSGWGINLAGGTHHAFRAHAEGFSLINDVVVCVQQLLDQGRVRRILVLDLDVHQGNGTAKLLEDEPRAFTLSVHGERNYPFRKMRSDLDLGLPDGVTDAEYLAVLRGPVARALEDFRPELLFYLAGSDVLAGDRFGRFALTLEGLAARDAWVFGWCAAAGVPLVSTMAGGYNRDPQVTVRAHAQTVEVGLRSFD